MPTWIALAAAAVGACAIIGGAGWVLCGSLAISSPYQDRRLAAVYAFAAGVFVALVLLDFLPDALQGEAGGPWAVCAGAIFLWLATQFLNQRFERTQQGLSSETRQRGSFDGTQGFEGTHGDLEGASLLTRASALVVMVSLALHSLLEGGSLAAAVARPDPHTWVFLIGMVIHKLPEGVLWALALLAAFPTAANHRRRLYIILCVPGAAGIVGAGAGLGLVHAISPLHAELVMAVLAGALVYIGFAELLPALRTFAYRSTIAWFLLGSICVGLLTGIVG
jgi:zinc transporter ZupT